MLLIDAGITSDEMAAIANDLRALGRPVVAGFSTHPHWDHVLWHPALGDAPRYGTARCAASIREVLATADWETEIAEGLPPEFADDIPMELLGLITGLPAGTAQIPWDGPDVRIIEHRGARPGHAALLIEERRVLVAGDMLSDVLIPMLDLQADDPIEDYLAALELIEGVADDVDVVIPGHGSVGGADELRARIDRIGPMCAPCATARPRRPANPAFAAQARAGAGEGRGTGGSGGGLAAAKRARRRAGWERKSRGASSPAVARAARVACGDG